MFPEHFRGSGLPARILEGEEPRLGDSARVAQPRLLRPDELLAQGEASSGLGYLMVKEDGARKGRSPTTSGPSASRRSSSRWGWAATPASSSRAIRTSS